VLFAVVLNIYCAKFDEFIELLNVFSYNLQKYFYYTITKFNPFIDYYIGFLFCIGKKVTMILLRLSKNNVKLTIILIDKEFY